MQKDRDKRVIDKDYKVPKGKKPATGPIKLGAQHLHDDKYNYEKLSQIKHLDKPFKDLSKEERKEGKKYFYAFVLDASAPCLNEKKTKYTAVLKVADDTVNPLVPENSNKKPIKIYFFCKREGAVPCITEVGTIIRVHRATTQVHEGKLSMYCDINNFGSWCTFKLKSDTAEDRYQPISHSDSSFQFLPADKARLDEIRKVASNSIKNLIQFEFCKSIEDATKHKFDDDFLALILKKKETKDKKNFKIKFCDATTMGKLIFSKEINKKFELESGQVVRIRSINYNEKEKCFFLKPHSNMIKIPEISKTSKEFMSKLKASKNKEIALYLRIYINYLEEYTLTKPSTTPSVKQPVSLKALTTDNKTYPSGKTYAVSASAINIDPRNVKGWTSKGKAYSFNIECKDIANYEDDKTYTIEVNAEAGKNFIPVPFKSDLKDKEILKKLKLIKKLFLNTNCLLEMSVLKQEGKLVVSDTAMKVEFN